MQFLVISPQHPDYAHHIRRLAAAFSAIDTPKDDYQDMCRQLSAGTLSLYHATGDGADLSIVGEIDGHSYYVWAIAGKGFRPGVAELLKRIKLAGLKSITYATAKTGMRRLSRFFGEVRETQNEWQENGRLCTWHELEV